VVTPVTAAREPLSARRHDAGLDGVGHVLLGEVTALLFLCYMSSPQEEHAANFPGALGAAEVTTGPRHVL